VSHAKGAARAYWRRQLLAKAAIAASRVCAAVVSPAA
jgi:hypothetical protein